MASLFRLANVKSVKCRKSHDNPHPWLHCFCSVLWNLRCLFIHIYLIETLKTSSPFPPVLPSIQKHQHWAVKSKSSPNHVQEIPGIVFMGEIFSHLKSSRKLGPCSCGTALTEVLSHFALNLKQDRLPKPWYLRFDFLKISLLLKWMLPYQRITQGGNSFLPVFALKCN